MLLSADIVDAEDARVLTTIGPLSAPAGQLEGGVEPLRDRVMTAIALRVDPKLKAWVYASNAPSTFESYRELRLGIDAFVATELAEATVHFGKAAALDSASATPLVWAAFARAYYWDTAADSILTELGASHRRMGPWDDAMVGLVKAFRGGDLPLAHRAAHAVASVVPNSEWRVLVASTAMSENRAKEALRVLRAVDPADGWINGWEFYWATIAQAYHLLGEFREELENDRRALTYWPNNMTLVQFEFKALGSLGWVAELGRRWDEVSGVRLRVPNFGPFGQETAELRAHVGTAAARPFYDRLLAQKRSQLGKGDSVGSDEDIRGGIASDLAMSGRVGAARAVLDSLLPVGQVPAYGLLVLDGEISAMQGDRDRAHRALAELEHPSVGPKTVGPTIGQDFPELDRAAIHALLGEKAEAVALIEQATRRGFAYRHVIHIIPGMDLLKGYPPFDALVRPVDSPETPR
jgi:tetratricopeptide (TPR) repeat protein